MKTNIQMDTYLVDYAMDLMGCDTPEKLFRDALQAYTSTSPKVIADDFGGSMPDVYKKNPQWASDYNGE